jgi:hypothetical protein
MDKDMAMDMRDRKNLMAGSHYMEMWRAVPRINPCYGKFWAIARPAFRFH